MTRPDWWAGTRAELAPALRDLRVAVYASGGAPYHHAALVAAWGGVPEPLSAEGILAGNLDGYDVLVMPGGGLNAMGGLLAPLGTSGTARIRDWVERGGMYVGSCAGAYLGARLPESFLDAHPEARGLHLLDLPIANAADGGLGGLDSPGVGVLRVRLTDPGHWLTRGLPDDFEIVHYNGPCFLPPAGSALRGAVTLHALTERFTPWEHSLPGGVQGPTLAERLTGQDVQLAVSGPLGEGCVVLFGSHPEFGFSSLQLGWGVAARLFANALAHQAGRRASGGRAPGNSRPTSVTLEDIAARLDHAAARFASLAAVPPDLVNAPAFLGQRAEEVWRDALHEAAQVSAATAAYLRDLAPQRPEAGPFAPWIDHAPAPGQDYGFVGLAQLAASIHRLMDVAEAHREAPPPDLTFPYDAWERSPYHLLASSYLSAAGLAACASLAAGTLGTLCGLNSVPYPLVSPPLPTEQEPAHD
ncbi:hypothetical protein E5F05_00955 (plasmid) [Deinococcus metallilatus]|uniref:Biotin-protein ligase N-terminal domain-containing protein n=1 Tax=Deinococcus metallilatus TaxID=1211322 RepID=A0AAJ5F7W5_9DEIO|nr:BPL-N domain-containing protein [Deinococcus metallilatus]MBB5293475.1 hypothetical protein [Deinococcus metallilatus]QBY06558.1 hypothetical protein E5F05_00955 [Deinococcus metallilatus]RXJ17901.1 hypothetical protein ERJ73_00565 [Deinococcus metallilatus]TLK32173.1 hypothetical protein FCS05_01585 [Deinococcus metallilatus]GMA15305.1 hypothetical protein GCM10025871_16360 [Deinococcus metallilatus]